MRALVEKMARGNIDYKMPELVLSENRIDIEIEPDMQAHGSFVISSADKREVKGIIYTDSCSVKIVNDQFAGIKCNIKYDIEVKNAKAEQNISGMISIVSNAGEYTIPYNINIKEKTISTASGHVKNIDDFTNLAQTDYEEAFKIFYSDRFKNVIIKDDMRYNSIYNGLIENWNRNLALEEFLIAAGQKKPVEICLGRYADEFENLSENISGIINIKKSGWGYTEIAVKAEGDFLYNCKEKVTYDNFAGNNYEYEYLINVNKLHSGSNQGRIIFTTNSITLEYDIRIEMPYENREKFTDGRKYIHNLMKEYLLFRTEKITANEWINNTEGLVNERLSKFPKDYLSMLIKAQVLLSTGRDDEAAELIGEAADVIIPNRESAMEIYCYYLYIKTLQKNNSHYTDDVKKEITEYYNNGHDSWELLWLLLYLEERYRINPSLKYAAIKEQFGRGTTSPMLYFEALKVLNDQPGLLRVLNKFEIQVIAFGSKYKCISKELKNQLIEVILSSKASGTLVLNVLISVFEQHPDNNVLEAICGMLIRENRTDNKYFKWYDRAVRAGLNITRLYEFYIESADPDYKGELLPAVYMYFNYNADSIAQKRDFLYCNVIMNKESKPSTYDSYKRIIQDYALEQLREKRMNDYLNVIYKDVLTDRHITEDSAGALSGVLQTYKISCDNPNIREVMAYHKESMQGQRAKLKNGKAYVKLYTKDPVIVFSDCFGNLYCESVEYKIEKLMDNEEFLNKCLEIDSKNEFLLLHYAEKYIDNNEMTKAVEVFSKISDWEELGGICKRQIVKSITEFYCDNYDGNVLDDYISRIKMEKQDPDTRNRIMEVLVLRGNRERALECINEYGFEGISPGKLQVFLSRLIEEGEFEENKVTLAMSRYVFKNGKFDINILKYLSLYYYGTTEEMFNIWIQCNRAKCLTLDFVEQLIAQMLFERNIANLYTVFSEYVANGGKRKIKNAVLSFYSFESFIMEQDVPDGVFDIMENELIQKYNMPDICKIAFLYHNSDKDDADDKTVGLCKKILFDISEYNINFEFFKNYNKWFDIPANIVDKTVIDYKTNPTYRVSIKYRIESEEDTAEENWTVQEMGQTYPGVFVKELPLFYCEKMEYSFLVDDGEKEIETETKEYKVDDKSIYNSQSRFGMINSMLICSRLNRESSLVQLAKNYTVNKEVSDKLFKIL